MRTISKIAALAAVLSACSQGGDRGAPSGVVRLSPLSLSATGDVTALVDRDTTTALSLPAPVRVSFSLAHAAELRAVKSFGARSVDIEVDGVRHTPDATDGWASLSISAPKRRTEIAVTLIPTGADSSIGEIELWGAGAPSAPRDPALLASAAMRGEMPWENAFSVAPEVDAVQLSPGARSCADLSFATSLPLAQVRRSWLAYHAIGVQRPFALVRMINGGAPSGGLWLGGGDQQHALADELDSRSLSAATSVRLCLPDDATQGVQISEARLVLETEDGTNLLDRDTQLRLAAAWDGQIATAADLPTGEFTLGFDRSIALASASVHVAEAGARAALRTSRGADRSTSLEQGWTALAVAPAPSAGASVQLDAAAGTVRVSEVSLSGSPAGAPAPPARIVVTSPRLRWSNRAFVGERFAARALVAGWAESPAGPGEVTVDGTAASGPGGGFSAVLARPPAAAEAGTWKVMLAARFPDGSSASREIVLDDDSQAEIDAENAAGGGPAEDDARFGREDEMALGNLDARGGHAQLGSDVAFDAPPGAVARGTQIGITRKGEESVPPLDAGMVNVTAPRGAGYRFTPAGQKFQTAVAITLPYDASLLPDGMSADDVQTFFYDEDAEAWQALPRRQLDRQRRRLVSETTHFTFMINAVLVAPDHPGPSSLNPTSIKDLKTASPSANVDYIEPPQANSQGTARVTLPLRLPPARGTYKPTLALAYDSSGGDGWTGVGWELAVSSIAIDTRFGVPYYDGTERYTLDGQQLVPAGAAACVDGSVGRRFLQRGEGSFDLIVRCGADPASYRFERTDRSGVLFLYGVSAEAKVASPRSGVAAVWHLERVIDPNGNLCRYVYEQDQRQASGSNFDALTGEDFRQAYLAGVHYSGKAARTGAAALQSALDREAGAYSVVFRREQSQGRLADRPDVVTSARTGFKVVTRHRLHSVEVWIDGGPAGQTGIVREYSLAYELGDFFKSRLVSVDVYGRGGAAAGRLFHRHRLSYSDVEAGFAAPVPWSFDSPDGQPITASRERTVSGHAYAGIAFGPTRSSGSVGFSVGTSHRDQSTEALFIDLNGDGLPDRVSVDGSGRMTVQFNQSRTDSTGVHHAISSLAPQADPLAGGKLLPFASPIPSLGSESGDSVNFGVQGVFGSFSANAGGSNNWSTSSALLMDADGDGLPDFVGGGQVLFNYPRTCSGPGCCPAGQFCFGTEKPVGGTHALGNLPTAANVAADPGRIAGQQAVQSNLPPNDTLVEWTAPWAGVVSVSGSLLWTRTPPAGTAQDGVRLRIYLAREDGTMDAGGAPLVELRRLPADTAATPLSLPSVAVQAHDHLYFVLSTLLDFPIGSDGSVTPPRPVSLEEVELAPVVAYTSCSGACGTLSRDDATLVDPTGAPLFTFDEGADFRLAGGPMTVVQAAFSGTLHVSGPVTKRAATADDARACVQRYSAGQTPADEPCGSAADVFLAELPAGTSASVPADFDLAVIAGDSLVFRIASDLSIDPAAISWAPSGVMTSVCTASGCHTPTDVEAQSLRFDADPYIRVHGRSEPIPVRPLIVDRGGTLSISSSGVGLRGAFTVGVRVGEKLVLKHHAGETASTSVQVRTGDQVYFELHAESDPGFRSWPLTVTLNGLPRAVPQHVTFDGPIAPFGGGFHGWRYGTWNGTAGETFDATIFYAPVELTLDGAGAHDQFLDGKRKLRDPVNPLSQRSRLFSPMVPRARGTLTGNGPGLSPVPAFVSADGTAFVTSHSFGAGRRGAIAPNADPASSVQAMFAAGDLSRASSGSTVSAGLGISFGPANLSLNVSSGSTIQTVDVRDMNGDGVIDVALDGQGAQLTDIATLGVRSRQGGAPIALQKSSDLSLSLGLGYSEPFRNTSAGGTVRGLESMYPGSLGGGLGANLSAVDVELIDVNADGLPDQVRLDRSTHRMMVRLNLGTAFAEAEDALPDAAWGSAGNDLLAGTLQDGVGNVVPGDSEEQGGQAGALGALDKLASPDVVRRSTAASVQVNAGFVFEEMYGATVNFESTLNGTSVMLVDVTGDGLPDWVRKGAGDSSFLVKVNTGFGFGPEQVWPASAWPVEKPQLQLPIGALQDLVNQLGFGGGADGLEATAIHSAVPSVGFTASVVFPIIPITGPWLILSGGGDVSPKKISGYQLTLMDIDGDGLPDHVLKTDGSNGSTAAVYARLNRNGGANLLTRVDEPLGGSFDLAYARAGNTVDMPENRYVLVGVQLHDGLETGAGHDLTTSIAYDGGYRDRAEREFFGFATVQSVRPDGSTLTEHFLNDSYRRRGLLASEELRDASGMLFSASVRSYDDAPVLVSAAAPDCSAAVPFFLSPSDSCSAGWVRLNRVESRSHEGRTAAVDQPGIATAQQFQYDTATGNLIAFEELGDVADPADDLSATIEYAAGSAAQTLHALDRPEHVRITAGLLSRRGAVLRERWADFDAAGNLSELRTALSAGTLATSNFTWNDDGNLQRYLAPPNARGQRYAIDYAYDPATRQYVESITDSFGYASRASYDIGFGEVLSSTDLAGNTTVRRLDDMGRLVALFGPYDPPGSAVPTVSASYDLDARPAWALTSNKLPNPKPGGGLTLDHVSFEDGLRREVQTRTDDEVRGVQGLTVSGRMEYDVMGRMALLGQARFSTGGRSAYEPRTARNPTSFTRDVLGRTIQVVAPDGSLTLTRYGFGSAAGDPALRFRTEVIDAEGRSHVHFEDGQHRVSAVEERIEGRVPTTRYLYDPIGQLRTIIDAAGNRSEVRSDLGGRTISSSSPDSGLVEYAYDAAGDLVSKVDPNLRALRTALRYEYDFTHLTRVVRPLSGDVTFEYGAAGAAENAAGRISRIVDEAGVETRGYGRLGEMVRTTRTLPPLVPGNVSRTFETLTAYDSFGRMLSLRYPDGEALAYGYDGGGQVSGAVGQRPVAPHSPAASEIYLAGMEYDEFGARVSMTLGNGVVTRYGYDPRTRRLSTLSTVTPSGRAIQLLQYTYDRVGNLTDLVNALAPSTHHRSGPVAAHYQYDALDRLVGARATADGRPGLVDRYFASYAYSDIHNLTRNTQVHELLHGPNGSAETPPHSNHDYAYQYSPGLGPHQARSIGDLSLAYDDNGNTSIQCRAHGGSCAGAKDVGNGVQPASHDHWRRYDWTEENWLRQVVDGGGHVTRFLYGANGERVVKFGRGAPSLTIGQFFSVQGSHHATKHVFAGGARIASKLIPVAEEVALWGPAAADPTEATDFTDLPGCAASGGTPPKCIRRLPPGPAKPTLQSATYYYHPDHLGSTAWMTDSGGRVHEHLEYFPYGDVWRDSKLDQDPGPSPRTPDYLFTGKEFDEETHLTYFGARYYDSRLAHWVSNDPALLRVDVHQPYLLSGYLYGQGSPVRYTDPDGRSPLDIVFLVVDVASAIKDPSLTNLAFVALDVATLATPLPSAGAVRAGVKGLQVLNKVHEAAEIASTTKKVAEVAHGVEVAAHAADAAKAVKAAETAAHAAEAGKAAAEVGNAGKIAKASKAEILAANKAAGKAAEEKVKQELLAEGHEILGSQVTVHTSKGKRIIDHLIKTADGRLVAIEVKSGEAVRSTAQLEKDAALLNEGGKFVGKNATQELKRASKQGLVKLDEVIERRVPRE